MNTILLLLLSIFPALILLAYFERQDKGKKEPRKLRAKVFLYGILAVIAAIFIEVILEEFFTSLQIPTIYYIFLTSFITAAITEESLKLWVVRKNLLKSIHFDEAMDGITYTIIASMGFATMENIMYVLDGGVYVAVLRAFTAVPAHALFSGIMGYYILRPKKSQVLTGLCFGVFYHGLYNFLLMSQSAWLILSVLPLMVFMWFHLRKKIKQARIQDGV